MTLPALKAFCKSELISMNANMPVFYGLLLQLYFAFSKKRNAMIFFSPEMGENKMNKLPLQWIQTQNS